MTKLNIRESSWKFECETCSFKCSKLSGYNKHLNTAKHKIRIIRSTIIPKAPSVYSCECGHTYKHQSSLWNHRQKCDYNSIDAVNIQETPISTNHPIQENRDDLIEKLVAELHAERAEKSDMKSMFMLMMEKYQEMQIQNQENTREILKESVKGNHDLVNKVIDVIPKMGNTTNNNTLNFYLTNTCKDAESIHDFTDRYVKQCTDFFKENYRNIANNQICLATSVYDIMFKCMKDNPQDMNFIQTTDVKNGVHYVKEKKKDENRQLYGEAEFIRYVDGFERAGASIGNAINKSFFQLQSEFVRKLELEVGPPPDEEDFEDEDEYENVLYKYKIRKQDSIRSLKMGVCNTISLFDSKTRQMDILKNTKRVKEDEQLP